jgi:hypothetical protein
VCPLRGQSLESRLAAQPGVERISREPALVTEVLLYLFSDIVVGLFGGTFLWMTRQLNQDKHAKPVVIGWFVFIGSVLGGISAAFVGWRITPETRLFGISLIVTPLALGALAHFVGRLRTGRQPLSHIATWYGGVAVGIGLAAGRLGALRLMGQV